MNTRHIYFIEPDEDTLQKEVDWANSHSMEELFNIYCDHVASNLALSGIDIESFSINKEIYFMDEPDQQ